MQSEFNPKENVIKEDADRFFWEMNDRPLKFFTRSELNKIRHTTIALAGFGGGGAIMAELLARWGIAKFRLLDMDRYETSNMNRQIFATANTLGRWKAEVAAQRIKEINPYVEIEMVICEKLNKENVERFIKGADIVIQATDTTSSSLLFHRMAKNFGVPLIMGHCFAVTAVKIHIFDYRNPRQRDFDEPSSFQIVNNFTQKLFDVSKKSLAEVTNEELDQMDRDHPVTPTLNFITNMVGCLVVAETIKFIIGRGRSCRHPKEIYMDLFDLKMKVHSAYSLSYIKYFLISHKKQISENFRSFFKQKFTIFRKISP